MKINVYYDVNGISFFDVISKDFMSFLQEYLKKHIK